MVNINHYLKGFNGTESYYQHAMSGYHYTDGVQYLAINYGCFWLLDAIASHQINPKVSFEEFQVWILKRISGYEFRLYCEDGNDNFITEQIISYSDFTGDEITVWFVDGTMLLPSEY